jgi:hypothetical protein
VDERVMADLETMAPGEDPQVTSPDAETPNKPVGLFQMDDDDVVKRLRQWFKDDLEHNNERRKERKKEWAALAGKQWEQADLTRMSGQKRTTLTLNLLQTMLAAVEGEERTNRQELHFYGEEEGDDVSAAAWNRLIKWIMDQCGGEFSLSTAFRHGSAVGEGWVVPDVDFYDDPRGAN